EGTRPVPRTAAGHYPPAPDGNQGAYPEESALPGPRDRRPAGRPAVARRPCWPAAVGRFGRELGAPLRSAGAQGPRADLPGRGVSPLRAALPPGGREGANRGGASPRLGSGRLAKELERLASPRGVAACGAAR